MFKLNKNKRGKRFANFKKLMRAFNHGISHLIFPNSCISCVCELHASEKYICHFCWGKIVFTYHENTKEPSSLDKIFWGRVFLNETFSLFYFEQAKPSQEILHALKYQYKPNLGIAMGEKIAHKIQENKLMLEVQALIPVPLHPKKEFIRGYNQSEKIALGISKVLGIPVFKKQIKKIKHTESQTKKDRFHRWENVATIFGAENAIIPFQHVAIVDDVVTTGATIEALANKLLSNNPELKISIISLALAK